MSEQTPKPSRFGANQWLVDELYEKFKADKNSVDAAWWDFFNDYTPSENPVPQVNTESKVTFITAPPTTTIMPPAQEVPAGQPHTSVPQTVAPTPAPSAVRDLRPSVEQTFSAEPAEVVALKGASARVVTNMENSLSIPTATSVRAIPAKPHSMPAAGRGEPIGAWRQWVRRRSSRGTAPSSTTPHGGRRLVG